MIKMFRVVITTEYFAEAESPSEARRRAIDFYRGKAYADANWEVTFVGESGPDSDDEEDVTDQ